MKKRKAGAIFTGTVLVIGLMLSGCGNKVTAESLMKDSYDKLQKVKSCTADMNMEMSMNIQSDVFSGTLDMNMDMEMQAIKEPEAAYINGKISLMGMDLSMESYSIKEDDKYVTYVSSMGEWTKTVTDTPDNAGDLTETAEKLMTGLDYVLAENTEKINDKEMYVLTATVDKDKARELMNSGMGLVDDMVGEEDISLDNVTIDLTYYISKTDKTLSQIQMIFNGLNGASAEESASIEGLTVSIVYTGFDNVASIVVPDEVKSAAEQQ